MIITPSYRQSSISIEGFDLSKQQDIKQSVSFLTVVLAIFPDGLGWATVGFPYEGFDEDCGPFIDYEEVNLIPFEFIAEIFEAPETKYRMTVEMKTFYRNEIDKVAATLISKAAMSSG